jgi:hypothetical protein
MFKFLDGQAYCCKNNMILKQYGPIFAIEEKRMYRIQRDYNHTCLEETFGSTSKPPNNIYIILILGKNAEI